MPNRAVFVENRLRRIVATGRVDARVIAPVPWFPLRNPVFGSYAAFAATPREEERHGILVSHPRYLVVPKIGTDIQPVSYLMSVRREIQKLQSRGFDFDLIDAHYLFPDGVAATQLAKVLGKPVVVSARGSDLNFIAGLPGPGRQIRRALAKMNGLIVVSTALGEQATKLGMPSSRIAMLRNGVDTDLFRPVDGCRWRALSLPAKAILLTVGNLVPLKGHDLIIRALSDLEGVHLQIAGEGPERSRLVALAEKLGVADRVRFLGVVNHEELASVYSAADVLVLASEREGWPNVLLEAMACGTPVVAAAVGGIPEIVNRPIAGTLFKERSPRAIAAAVQELLVNRHSREDVRAHACSFSWDDTVNRQIAFYEDVIEEARDLLSYGRIVNG